MEDKLNYLLTQCNLLKQELKTLKSIINGINQLYFAYPDDSIKILLKKASEIVNSEDDLMSMYFLFSNFDKRKFKEGGD